MHFAVMSSRQVHKTINKFSVELKYLCSEREPNAYVEIPPQHLLTVFFTFWGWKRLDLFIVLINVNKFLGLAFKETFSRHTHMSGTQCV